MPSKNATTVYLSDDERTALQLICAREERSQSAVIGRLIRQASNPPVVVGPGPLPASSTTQASCNHLRFEVKNGGIKVCSTCQKVLK